MTWCGCAVMTIVYSGTSPLCSFHLYSHFLFLSLSLYPDTQLFPLLTVTIYFLLSFLFSLPILLDPCLSSCLLSLPLSPSTIPPFSSNSSLSLYLSTCVPSNPIHFPPPPTFTHLVSGCLERIFMQLYMFCMK